MSPFILFDNASPDIKFSGEHWQSGYDPDVHGGSFNTCRTDLNISSTASGPSAMSLSFYGTGISFYGQPSKGLALNYTFDNSRSRVADANTTDDVSGKTGIRIWGVQQVPSGFHSISLIPTSGQPSFDYAVVTPMAGTPLNEKILVLDDSDPLIKYKGNWTLQSGKKLPTGISFGGSIRGTTKKGDGLTLKFVGASISVYGVLNQLPGTLSSTYSIDGGPPATFTAYNGTQTGAPDVWALSQQFFSKEVVPGNHTLDVTVSEITGSQVFWIDYLTFEGTSSTTLTPKADSSPSQSGSKFNEKIIGGIVAGAIVLIILYSCLRDRSRRLMRAWVGKKSSDHDPHIPPPIYEPPRQPSPLHVPPHFPTPGWGYSTSPGANDPAIPLLQREIDNLRLQNEQIQREATERTQREAEERVQREAAERTRREADERAQRERVQTGADERPRREASDRTVREATERPPPAAATDAGPADPPPPYNDSHYIP